MHVKVSIDPGCFFAFNNFRGVHKQALAGDGYCLCYKIYTRHSLRALQADGESGPIFSVPDNSPSEKDLGGSHR
jgi:hypothetical protein